MNPIIRPPVLNLGGQNNEGQNINVNPISRQNLEDIVERIARRILVENNTAPGLVDEQINNQEEIGDLDKIPDIVKSLKDFAGNPAEFSSWKKSVDRIMQIYSNQRGTAKYFGIIHVIRNKIIGEADTALESYNTPLNWEAISKCLTTHYADKRDIGTLEYQLTSLIQGNKTTVEFYQEIFGHLSLLLNKINCMDAGPETVNVLTESYRRKALDTFIRGLNGDLPRLLGIKEPRDLPEALHLCQKLENQNFRSDYASRNHQNLARKTTANAPQRLNIQNSFAKHSNPRVAPQTHQTSQNFRYYQPPTFQNYQEVINHQNYNPPRYVAPPPQNYQPRYVAPPPRPVAPKPLPKPVPMEIDSTIQTRQVNYMNRPIRQNNYHTTTEELEDKELKENSHENEQSLEEYYSEYEQQYSHFETEKELDSVELADVHFLG